MLIPKSPKASSSNSTVNLYSFSSPALGFLNDSMYLVYPGLCFNPTNSGQNLYWAVYEDDQWTSNGPITVAGDYPYNNLQSFVGGGLCPYVVDSSGQQALYIVYKGVTGGELYWASYAGSDSQWSNLGPLSNFTAMYAPALGGGSNAGQTSGHIALIYPTGQGGVEYAAYSYSPGRWSDPSQLVSSSDPLSTSATPAIAVLGSQMVVVYPKSGKSGQLYWALYNGSKWIDEGAITCADGSHLFTAYSGFAASPVMTAFNGNLYMAYQGITPQYQIYWASFDGSNWQNLHSTGLSTNFNPAMATTPDQSTMYMVFPLGNMAELNWAGSKGTDWASYGAISANVSDS